MTEVKKWTETASIPKTYARACEENLGITKYFLREACRKGRLKHKVVYNQYILIYWPDLMNFLQNGGNTKDVEEYKEIKPVAKNIIVFSDYIKAKKR